MTTQHEGGTTSRADEPTANKSGTKAATEVKLPPATSQGSSQPTTKIIAARMAAYLLGQRTRHSSQSGAQHAGACGMIPLESRNKCDRSPLLSFDYSPSTGCLVPFRPGSTPSPKLLPCSRSSDSVDTPPPQRQTPASDGVCPYLSAVIPAVQIDKYILRALDYSYCSPNCGVLTLILMMRLTHCGPTVEEEGEEVSSEVGSPLLGTATSSTTTDEVSMDLNALTPGTQADLVVPLSLWTFHRLFFSCFVLAVKWLEDKTYVMGYYASVGGFPTSKELCGLEGETFRRLGFSLWPSDKEWSRATDVLGLDIPLVGHSATSSCPASLETPLDTEPSEEEADTKEQTPSSGRGARLEKGVDGGASGTSLLSGYEGGSEGPTLSPASSHGGGGVNWMSPSSSSKDHMSAIGNSRSATQDDLSCGDAFAMAL